MNAWFTLALLLPTVTSFILCSAFWGRSQSLPDWLARAFVSFGVGVGLSSCTFFFGLLSGNRSRTGLTILDALLLAVAGAILLAMRHLGSEDGTPGLQRASPCASLITYLLASPLLVATLISFHYCIRYAAAHPHGTWDSWSIWTLKARFLFRSGAHWRDAFSPVIAYSHPDYPILLPATIDRLWTYLQHEALFVPTMLGFFFMLCTVGLVMSSVAVMRSKSQALLAGAVLLTTPFFVKHAVSADAESPFMFFVLATTVLLIMSDSAPRMLVLSGLTASLAAWTKNEGLLFLVSVITSLAALLFVARGWNACVRAVSLFIVGACPVLIVIVLFKSQVHAGNWLFGPTPNGVSILGRLMDVGRYSMISKYYYREIPRFGEWEISMVPVLVAYFFLMGHLRGLKEKPGLVAVIGALAIASLGYFFVYVITPTELAWQLDTSLNRILLQFWPAAVVVFFCVTRTPEEALALPCARLIVPGMTDQGK